MLPNASAFSTPSHGSQKRQHHSQDRSHQQQQQARRGAHAAQQNRQLFQSPQNSAHATENDPYQTPQPRYPTPSSNLAPLVLDPNAGSASSLQNAMNSHQRQQGKRRQLFDTPKSATSTVGKFLAAVSTPLSSKSTSRRKVSTSSSTGTPGLMSTPYSVASHASSASAASSYHFHASATPHGANHGVNYGASGGNSLFDGRGGGGSNSRSNNSSSNSSMNGHVHGHGHGGSSNDDSNGNGTLNAPLHSTHQSAATLSRVASKAGYLNKLGANIPEFKRRFFVLQQTTKLYYYLSPNDVLPRGALDLQNCEIQPLSPDGQPSDGRFRFILQLSNPNHGANSHQALPRNVVLEARSKDQAQEWMKNLQEEQLDYQKEQVEVVSQRCQKRQLQIKELQDQLAMYAMIEQERDDAIEDAQSWKHQYQSIERQLGSLAQKVSIKFQLQLDDSMVEDDAPLGDESKEDPGDGDYSENDKEVPTKAQHQAGTVDDGVCRNDGHGRDGGVSGDDRGEGEGKENESMEQTSPTKEISESALMSSEDSLSLLSRLCDRVHQSLKEANNVMDSLDGDLKESHKQHALTEKRMQKAEKHILKLWEENCALRKENKAVRKTLKQKKRDKRVLVRELKAIHTMQLEEEQRQKQQLQQQRQRHLEESQRRRANVSASLPATLGGKSQLTQSGVVQHRHQPQQDAADDGFLASDEERLFSELEEHVSTSIRLNEKYLRKGPIVDGTNKNKNTNDSNDNGRDGKTAKDMTQTTTLTAGRTNAATPLSLYDDDRVVGRVVDRVEEHRSGSPSRDMLTTSAANGGAPSQQRTVMSPLRPKVLSLLDDQSSGSSDGGDDDSTEEDGDDVDGSTNKNPDATRFSSVVSSVVGGTDRNLLSSDSEDDDDEDDHDEYDDSTGEQVVNGTSKGRDVKDSSNHDDNQCIVSLSGVSSLIAENGDASSVAPSIGSTSHSQHVFRKYNTDAPSSNMSSIHQDLDHIDIDDNSHSNNYGNGNGTDSERSAGMSCETPAITSNGQATSRISCPLADIVETYDDSKDSSTMSHGDTWRVYHLEFHSQKIGIQFCKVPPPPKEAQSRGLLTEAIKADMFVGGHGDALMERGVNDLSSSALNTCQVATPSDFVLVCGFEGFNLSLSMNRPKLGARLVAFDGISVENGPWTFDSIRRAIKSRSRPLKLSFRNDPLTPDQRSILTQALNDVDVHRGPQGRPTSHQPMQESYHSGIHHQPASSASHLHHHDRQHQYQQTQQSQQQFGPADEMDLHDVQLEHDPVLDLSSDTSNANCGRWRKRLGSVSSQSSSNSTSHNRRPTFQTFSEAGSSVISASLAPLMANLLKGVSDRSQPSERTPPAYLARRELPHNDPQHQNFQSSLL